MYLSINAANSIEKKGIVVCTDICNVRIRIYKYVYAPSRNVSYKQEMVQTVLLYGF